MSRARSSGGSPPGGTPLAEEKAETMDRSRTLRQVIEQFCEGLDQRP